MSQDDGQEKSFEASTEKIRKARTKGNVPISTDLALFLMFVGVLIGLYAAQTPAISLGEALGRFLWTPVQATDRVFAGEGGDQLVLSALWFLTIIVGPAAALIVVGLIVQQAIVFAPTKLKPDLKRLSPIEGIKNKYGPRGMAEFLKSGGKITATTICGGLYLWSRREHFAGVLLTSPEDILPLMLAEVAAILMIGTGIALFVAVLDVPFRRLAHNKRLRMSRQEMTDENKEMEGDPTQRNQRKQRAKDIAQAQTVREVERADVLIVNPTHYAVALLWQRTEETVPVCVAKGKDELALTMIERARSKGVPVREDPPCARALFATVNMGEAIKPEHFAAVAAAIRFADRVRSQ